MKNVAAIFILLCSAVPSDAQQMLSLDSCRAMALRNNKQINIARLKKDVATNTRKAARTKYLPHIDVLGGYEFMSKEISILNNEQKGVLGSLGTTAAGELGNTMSSAITDMVSQGVISPQTGEALGNIAGKLVPGIQNAGNAIGKSINDAFRTDTRNIFTASVMLRQPIFMGGGIVAANKIADISEQLTDNEITSRTQNTIYDIDNAYWTIVSLKHKEKLANSYLNLVKS